MFAYGIAVYTVSQSESKSQKIISLQSLHNEKNSSDSENAMEHVSKIVTVEFYSSMDSAPYQEVRAVGNKNEYSYFMKLKEVNLVLAICVDKDLFKTPGQLLCLLRNVESVILRPNLTKHTLRDIIIQPLNYIRQDIMLGQAEENMSHIKRKMFENVEKAIKRGESIECLMDKTVDLEQTSRLFNGASKQQNSCYPSMGGCSS